MNTPYTFLYLSWIKIIYTLKWVCNLYGWIHAAWDELFMNLYHGSQAISWADFSRFLNVNYTVSASSGTDFRARPGDVVSLGSSIGDLILSACARIICPVNVYTHLSIWGHLRSSYCFIVAGDAYNLI